jgi:uncharacterized membrane protein YphA (DoxX/SURF4 family)
MKKLLENPIPVLILRLFIGGLFVYASVDKIAQPHKFAIAIDNYHFLPEVLVNLWAIALPWTELVIGLFLIAGVFVEASALVSALMYLSFLIALSAALARGLDIGCGCFELTESEARINYLYLGRDFSLLLGSVWILVGYRGKLALEGIWRKG